MATTPKRPDRALQQAVETLKRDLRECSEHVGRLERIVNDLKDEVSHLREKIRN